MMAAMLDATNPFARPSALPFQLPDFAALRPEHYRAAFEEGMAESLAELAAIAANPEPPTAENVLDAWERSGQVLDRATTTFYVVKSADTTPELDALGAEFAPRFAEHSDRIFMDPALYARLTALQARASAGEVTLSAEEAWLLDDLLAAFVRAGVALGPEEQARLRQLNGRLAQLGTEFEQTTLAARNAAAVLVSDPSELEGLAADEIESLKTDEGYRLELVNTTQQPLAERLVNRDVRRRLFEASVNRALTGDVDTRPLIVEQARLRAERATLLGYPNHAALVVERSCARTTAAVAGMLARLAPAALAQAKKDAETLSARFAELYPGETFQAWDWAYVAEVVRRERFDLDLDQLAPHLTIDKVLAAMYSSAERLYGITFVRRPELRGHTADAEVYEVRDADGSVVGAYVFDGPARPTKQGGAWMNNIVNQSHLLGERPVVTNNCNFAPGSTTISWDGVITMFHEFGHALHGLFADTRYPSHSGTSTPRDFVEFPSQVNEHWAWEPGAVIPAEWAARLREADTFNQGFANFEAWSAMVLDQAWHTTPLAELPAVADEVEAFERAALERAGISYELIPPRYRSQYFSHIWGGGYAAAYYGYVWSEVMDADAVDWFDENGGETRANGERFRRTLLAPGGSVDALTTWRAFRGRDPEIGPLLRRVGLAGAS